MAQIELVQGKLEAVPEKPKREYSFKKANRALDTKEEEAEAKAIKFNKKNFPRINPVQGTLGYTFRNLAGGNEAVVAFLKNANKDRKNSSKFLKNFFILWKVMDDFSKKRVDIFDVFCEAYDVDRGKFFGIVQEGMFNHENAMRQVSLSGYTDEFIDLVKRMAAKEKNSKDRDLLADMLKLKSNSPLVSIQDNSVKNELHVHTEKASVPSFISSIKKGDEGIRREVSTERIMPQKEVKQLSEGNQDYIEAEVISETREEVPVERSEEDFDWEMRKSAQEL